MGCPKSILGRTKVLDWPSHIFAVRSRVDLGDKILWLGLREAMTINGKPRLLRGLSGFVLCAKS
jgi:hypothetical protein